QRSCGRWREASRTGRRDHSPWTRRRSTQSDGGTAARVGALAPLCGAVSRLLFLQVQGIGCIRLRRSNGGEGGIRTHGTLARTTVFETAPFDRSGTSPRLFAERGAT